MHAIAAEEISALDLVTPEIRRHYFLRRSIGTLHEFSEALQLLDSYPDFQTPIKTRFDSVSLHRWDRAVKFFSRIDAVLRNVRNDVGGHFGLTAALYAVRNLQADSMGRLEVEREWRANQKELAVTAKVHFAGELAATVFFRHLEGKTRELKARYFHRKLVLGYHRAIWAVNSLMTYTVVDRLGK